MSPKSCRTAAALLAFGLAAVATRGTGQRSVATSGTPSAPLEPMVQELAAAG